MTDNLIIKIVYSKSKPSTHYIRNKDKYPNITNYIINRYKDSKTFRESLDRMKFGIEERPVCKHCGNNVKYKGLGIYQTYCCRKCSWIDTEEKRKETWLEKYGFDNPAKSEKVKEKGRQTCLNKYGVTNGGWAPEIREKIKKTNQERYGVDMPLQSKEILDKTKETSKEKFGTEYYMRTKEFREISKEIFLDKYGVDCPMKNNEIQQKLSNKLNTEEVRQKIYDTKKRNNSFNTSKPEEELFLYIKSKFPTVKRQYRDKIYYPYNCDFYIPELNYFIELNGLWTHGGHPFNPFDDKDKIKLDKWKNKAKEHLFYKGAIKVWTISDVNKRETAKRNNLNFKEVWSLEEGKMFIDFLYSKYHKQ